MPVFREVSDYDRHVGKRLRETFVPGQGFLPTEPRQSRGWQVNLPRRTPMNGRKMLARKILATAAFCTLLTGAGLAQVTGQTIQNRKNDQQGRIAQGVRSGQLTRGETRNVESRERSVNHEEHAMRRADGGHLTAGDKAALTRRQNNISRSIYKDKHNARVR